MSFRPEKKKFLKQSKTSKCFKGVSPWFRQKNRNFYLCVFWANQARKDGLLKEKFKVPGYSPKFRLPKSFPTL